MVIGARGSQGMEECWKRASMDVCHADNQLYLTLVDCGPSRYAIWRRLKRQDSESVITQLESIFLERDAPAELPTDNYPSFRSAVFDEFTGRWGVSVRYRAANVPSGNDISERKHRSMKTLAARKRCSVAEAVYRYNALPRSDDQASIPMETLFNYWVRVSDVAVPADADISRFNVGDRV